MKFLFQFFWISLGVLFFVSCAEDQKRVIKTASIEFTKEGELTIYKGMSDSVITKYDIEIAESDYETQTGLMYRESMGTDEAMLFIFPTVEYHSFYMKNTTLPLDILFIDENLQIVSYRENAKPLDESGISSEFPIQYVLEVNAGQSQEHTISVGDRIVFKRL